VSGYTSKAWSVRRIGPDVFLTWGAVEVRGAGHSRRIYWAAPPRQKTVRCGTAERAIEYVKHSVSRRISHVYERLPESVPIKRRLVRRNAEPALTTESAWHPDLDSQTVACTRSRACPANGVCTRSSINPSRGSLHQSRVLF
jgi:hypothetical protein